MPRLTSAQVVLFPDKPAGDAAAASAEDSAGGASGGGGGGGGESKGDAGARDPYRVSSPAAAQAIWSAMRAWRKRITLVVTDDDCVPRLQGALAPSARGPERVPRAGKDMQSVDVTRWAEAAAVPAALMEHVVRTGQHYRHIGGLLQLTGRGEPAPPARPCLRLALTCVGPRAGSRVRVGDASGRRVSFLALEGGSSVLSGAHRLRTYEDRLGDVLRAMRS
jgi:hypothetical protein